MQEINTKAFDREAWAFFWRSGRWPDILSSIDRIGSGSQLNYTSTRLLCKK